MTVHPACFLYQLTGASHLLIALRDAQGVETDGGIRFPASLSHDLLIHAAYGYEHRLMTESDLTHCILET